MARANRSANPSPTSSDPIPPDHEEAARRAPVVELLIGAAWLMGLGALLTLGDGFLSAVPLARAILGGLVASIAASRAGIDWDRSDPEGESPSRAARGVLIGSGATATACLLAIVVSQALGWARVEPGHPGWMLALAIAAAVGGAVREEVLLRAIPLHFARRAGIAPTAAIVFASLASATSFLLSSTTTGASVALAVAAGLVSARLLERTGSLWAAVGANTAFSLFAGPFTQGGLFDLVWARGELARGAQASGPPAIVAAVVLALVALAVGRGPLRLGDVRRAARRSPRSPRR